MIAKEYSPKEILIIESLLDLYKQGIPFHAVKVADIATAADIGKGTVYEYFHSKEEIIAHAIAYRIAKEFQEITVIIENATSFSRCSYHIFESMTRCYATQSDSFFFLRPDILAMEEVVSVFHELQEDCEAMEMQLLKEYLTLGVREGLFPPIEKESYALQTITSVMAGLHIALQTKKNVSEKEIKENCYTLLLRALQPLPQQ